MRDADDDGDVVAKIDRPKKDRRIRTIRVTVAMNFVWIEDRQNDLRFKPEVLQFRVRTTPVIAPRPGRDDEIGHSRGPMTERSGRRRAEFDRADHP